jgi:hypothetical protein
MESRTTGGGSPLVAVEWNVYILEELDLPTIATKEEQLIMCACLMTQNTPCLFELEYKLKVTCMEPSMKVLLLCRIVNNTMLLVLYATFLLDIRLS